MREAVGDRARDVGVELGAVHRLQEEVLEVGVGEALRRGVRLRVDELELVAAQQHGGRARLGADADPVDAVGRLERAVRLDGDLEARLVQRADERRRPSAGAARRRCRRRAACRGRRRLGHCAATASASSCGGVELAAAVAVGADEVGVAERADGRGAVLLVPRPEVAAGEAAEHGRPPGVGPLALQRVEDLLDGVGHPRPPHPAGRRRDRARRPRRIPAAAAGRRRTRRRRGPARRGRSNSASPRSRRRARARGG